MKKVLDAFLSALHFYEGPDLQEVVRRLAMKLNVEEKALAILLTDSSPALLGPKRSPALRGGGLQWSPDDHLLCEGEVVRKAANATQIVAALYGAA